MALRRKSLCLNLTSVEIQHLEETCRSSSLPVPAAHRAYMLLAFCFALLGSLGAGDPARPWGGKGLLQKAAQ